MYSIIDVEDDVIDVKPYIIKEGRSIIEYFNPEITEDEIKGEYLDIRYFRVDSYIVPKIREVLPTDLAEWEQLESDGDMQFYGTYFIFDVLKAFEIGE
jgi:hypothetical protein